MRSRFAKVLTCAGLLLSSVAITSDAVQADGLITQNFAYSYKTVSGTSYRYSNMSGFWQAIINSNPGTEIANDGNYGSQTTWKTASWQLTLGVSQTAAADFNTWFATYWAPDGVYATYRLNATGQVDAYATAYYTYYGGGDCIGKLGWNSFSSQWLFSQRTSQPSALVPATVAKTIGSVSATDSCTG